jgi:hypothetical protein
MAEKRVENATFFVDKESSSLQWLEALILDKHTKAVQGLIRATDEKESDKMRGRILLCSELLKHISDI